MDDLICSHIAEFYYFLLIKGYSIISLPVFIHLSLFDMNYIKIWKYFQVFVEILLVEASIRWLSLSLLMLINDYILFNLWSFDEKEQENYPFESKWFKYLWVFCSACCKQIMSIILFQFCSFNINVNVN